MLYCINFYTILFLSLRFSRPVVLKRGWHTNWLSTKDETQKQVKRQTSEIMSTECGGTTSSHLVGVDFVAGMYILCWYKSSTRMADDILSTSCVFDFPLSRNKKKVK